MARMELNEQDMEEVVGGAYHYYYHKDGTITVKVDNVGTYNCSPDAKIKIVAYKLENEGTPPAEVVQYAIDNGLYW